MKQLCLRLVDGINDRLYGSFYDRRPVLIECKLSDRLGKKLDDRLRSKIDGRRDQKVRGL